MAVRSGVSQPGRIKAAIRGAKALELRLASKPWAVIASELGYATPGCAYNAAMGVLRAAPSEDIAEFRKVEVARLEKIREAKWPTAPEDGEALDQYLSLTDRIHRILGIRDKLEITGKNGAALPAPQTNVQVNIQANFLISTEERQKSILGILHQAGIDLAKEQNGNGKMADHGISQVLDAATDEVHPPCAD